MRKNVYVKWNDAYLTGVPLLDEQHKRIINLANNLFRVCLGDEQNARIDFALAVKQFVYYVNYHFSEEERIMTQWAYPGLGEQKKDHEKFIKEVLLNIRIFESGQNFDPEQFVCFIRDQILTHIAIPDMRLGKYIQDIKNANLREQGAMAAGGSG
jgi:hemerythrin